MRILYRRSIKDIRRGKNVLLFAVFIALFFFYADVNRSGVEIGQRRRANEVLARFVRMIWRNDAEHDAGRFLRRPPPVYPIRLMWIKWIEFVGSCHIVVEFSGLPTQYGRFSYYCVINWLVWAHEDNRWDWIGKLLRNFSNAEMFIGSHANSIRIQRNSLSNLLISWLSSRISII